MRKRFGKIRRYLASVSEKEDDADREHQRKRTVILFWVAVASLAVAILQFAPTGAGWAGDVGEGVAHLFTGGGGGATVSIVIEPRVVNRQPDYAEVGGDQVPTRATAPQVDLYVRNEGDDAVELSKVKIEITDSSVLEGCIPPQGGGPESPPFELSYFVNLPPAPLPEQRTIYRTLHQRVPPHGSGSVNLYLRTLEAESLEHLYALKVTMLVEGDAGPVDVGRFVIGLPGPVSRHGSILPENEEAIDNLYAFDSQLETTWCYRQNMAAVSRILAEPGMRSPAMKAAASMRPAANWSAYADRRPARAAAEALLKQRPGFLDTPSLAVFAAAQTGDLRFEHGVEERAAPVLLSSAEEHVETSPRLAILETHAALGLEDSPAGRELLARAEAALRGLGDASDELSG